MAHHVLRVLVLFLMATPGLAQADFDYPDFSSTAGLTLVHHAVQSGTHVKLNTAIASQKGAIWSVARESVAGGFTSTFQLEVVPGGSGDGMAFVIQDQAGDAVGDHAGALGYGGFLTSPGNGLVKSVAIEFDHFQNGNMGDPNSNHISVHTDGTNPNSPHENFSIGSATTIASLTGLHVFMVTYDATTLSVYMDNGAMPVLAVPVNLQALIGGTHAWVGFTGSTGAAASEHRVHSWSFQSTVIQPPAGSFMRGDCNDDGMVNIADAVYLLGVLFPSGAPIVAPCDDACDANDDGRKNIADAIAALGALFGTPAIPLPPPASCGSDPTIGDPLGCGLLLNCP